MKDLYGLQLGAADSVSAGVSSSYLTAEKALFLIFVANRVCRLFARAVGTLLMCA